MFRKYSIINKLNLFETILFTLLFVFSCYLMLHTFGYDQKSFSMLIAPKAWSDFGAHIPLIRSFSLGPNLSRLLKGIPIQSPLFPGEPIRYHFGFYALVGILEKLGIRIDWALNIPSITGFFTLLLLVYLFACFLFQNRAVGVLSVIFLLFNGSFSFMEFFRKFPLSAHTFQDIIYNSRFPVFGPWDGQSITAFWTLNIYTNQRHLGLSYALILGIIYLLTTQKSFPSTKRALLFLSLNIFVAIASLLFINHAALGILMLLLGWLFLVKKNIRIPILFGSLLSIPVFLFLQRITILPMKIIFHPGYLVQSPLTINSFILFWFRNLGFHLIIIPLGILISPKQIQKLLLIPLIILFASANIWQFSPDMINNHKFFNFFLIIGSMFSAYFIVQYTLYILSYKSLFTRLIMLFSSLFLFIVLTISGIIDLFPIINDTKGNLSDIGSNPDIQYFLTKTPKDTVVLNSFWFYHPATLAGRAIYSGYPYFTWSYGYDKESHEQIARAIYNAETIYNACIFLKNNHINYIELTPKPEYAVLNPFLWNNSLNPAYSNNNFIVYDVRNICR